MADGAARGSSSSATRICPSSTPVQLAAPALHRGAARRFATRSARASRRNLAALAARVAATSGGRRCSTPEGGWSAVLRVPAIEPEEALVLRLLDEAHVLVHPGYFFDFAERGVSRAEPAAGARDVRRGALARLLPIAQRERPS